MKKFRQAVTWVREKRANRPEPYSQSIHFMEGTISNCALIKWIPTLSTGKNQKMNLVNLMLKVLMFSAPELSLERFADKHRYQYRFPTIGLLMQTVSRRMLRKAPLKY